MSLSGAPIPDFQLPNTNYGVNGQNGRVNFNQQPSSTISTEQLTKTTTIPSNPA